MSPLFRRRRRKKNVPPPPPVVSQPVVPLSPGLQPPLPEPEQPKVEPLPKLQPEQPRPEPKKVEESKSPVKFGFVKLSDSGDSFINVFYEGDTKLARSNNSNFAQIESEATAIRDTLKDDPYADVEERVSDLLGLFDMGKAIEGRFKRLSERISIRGNTVLVDNDPVDSSLTRKLVEIIDAGEEFSALVNYFENVYANPEPYSREQLYVWLNNHQVPITPDGYLVAYKGMHRSSDEEGEYFRPTTHGKIIVDGEEGSSRELKQRIGSVVEMPRSEVCHNPHAACSVGLHIGSFEFARDYARGGTGVLLEVHVNPRDVKSVPNDAGGAKIRVCRYKIIGPVHAKYTDAVVRSDVPPEPEPVEVEPVEPEVPEVEETPENPKQGTVDNWVVEAKQRKKGIPTIAKKYGYVWTGGDKTLSVSYVKASDEPSEAPSAPSGRHPSKAEMDELIKLAKRRKRGVPRVAVKEGWEYVGTDPKDRLSYVQA